MAEEKKGRSELAPHEGDKLYEEKLKADEHREFERLYKIVEQNKAYRQLYNIGILGDAQVGKTSFLIRFAGEKYTESYSQLRGVDWRRQRDILVWESAENKQIIPPDRIFSKIAHGIILMYDPFDADSFKHIEFWAEEAWKKFSGVSMILVSTKSDLKDPIITKEKGLILAKKLGIPFIQTSAKSNNNVKEALSILEDEIRFKSEFLSTKPLYREFLTEQLQTLTKPSIARYADIYKDILNLKERRALILKPFENRLIALSQSDLPEPTVCELARFCDWNKRISGLRAIFENYESSLEQQEQGLQELERLHIFTNEMAKKAKAQESEGGLKSFILGNSKLKEASKIFNDTSTEIAAILSSIHPSKKTEEKEKPKKDKSEKGEATPTSLSQFFPSNQRVEAAPLPQARETPPPSASPAASQSRGFAGAPS